MKTINDIMEELNITGNETMDQLLEKISLVTVDELNDVKSISVMPLPNVVRDRATELKTRLINIVSDEERGATAIINRRVALLYAVLDKYNTFAEQTELRLGALENMQELTLGEYVRKDLSGLQSPELVLGNNQLNMYVNANGVPCKINVEELRDRIIKTVDGEATVQTNQYVFEKI